jgi:maltose alpha-D-glucosyltransferase/alpha-amylase
MKNRSLRNSIIYNVYPVSFLDSNGDGVGDLNGIIEKLPYIAEFADIVWINPIFKSPFRDGGHDVEDYYAIDPKFGTFDDLKRLLELAKKLNLKILLDLVVGHTSDTHRWFLKSREPERNEYSDYYIWCDDVFAECPYRSISGNADRNGNYLINFFCFQPSLNWGFAEKKYEWQHLYTDTVCEKIHEEVIGIIKFYLRMGIDGFRVDMANIVKQFRNKHLCERIFEMFFS